MFCNSKYKITDKEESNSKIACCRHTVHFHRAVCEFLVAGMWMGTHYRYVHDQTLISGPVVACTGGESLSIMFLWWQSLLQVKVDEAMSMNFNLYKPVNTRALTGLHHQGHNFHLENNPKKIQVTVSPAFSSSPKFPGVLP